MTHYPNRTSGDVEELYIDNAQRICVEKGRVEDYDVIDCIQSENTAFLLDPSVPLKQETVSFESLPEEQQKEIQESEYIEHDTYKITKKVKLTRMDFVVGTINNTIYTNGEIFLMNNEGRTIERIQRQFQNF